MGCFKDIILSGGAPRCITSVSG